MIKVFISGKELHQVLENCLEKYESIGGRFPQVSGIFFTYDISKPPGQRVDSRFVKIQNDYLDLNDKYSLATNVFLKNVDKVLKNCPVKIDSENIPSLMSLAEIFFEEVKAKEENKKGRPLFVSRNFEKILIEQISEEIFSDGDEVKRLTLSFHGAARLINQTLKQKNRLLTYKQRKMVKETDKYKQIMSELENKAKRLAPIVEGRSIQITSQKVN